MTDFFKGKRVCVTGGEGMIGKELVELLDKEGALVRIADIKTDCDLTDYRKCKRLCFGVDYVFHLAGIKGNPKMTQERPVDFMAPMLQFDTNMIRAANIMNVKRFLYTSSIAVLNPETDKYPAWAKKTAEMLIEAHKKQYPNGTKYCIVRPSSIYGRYDNFEREGLMVISDLIKRGLHSEDGILKLWDNGEGVRDFVNAKDVALAMMLIMEKMPEDLVAIGGKPFTIKNVAEIICKELDLKLVLGDHDSSKDVRTISTPHLNTWGWEQKVSIENGIKEIIQWKKKQQ